MGGPWKPWLTKPHGTEARARRHYRDGETRLRTTCPQCWHAGRQAWMRRKHGPDVVVLPPQSGGAR